MVRGLVVLDRARWFNPYPPPPLLSESVISNREVRGGRRRLPGFSLFFCSFLCRIYTSTRVAITGGRGAGAVVIAGLYGVSRYIHTQLYNVHNVLSLLRISLVVIWQQQREIISLHLTGPRERTMIDPGVCLGCGVK